MAGSGDSYDFYESIGGVGIKLATRWFPILALRPADKHIVLGDARPGLGNARSADFDHPAGGPFLIPATPSPSHLLTREGFAHIGGT